jgi:hypothetical protein
MIGKQTTLDLNGPILSFVQQPQSVSISCEDVLLGSVATFVGIATATFPQQSPENPATNTGTIAYRWYDDNGPLFDDPPTSGGDGLTIVGANTTTLTLFENRVQRKLFLRATYIPSAYSQPPGSAVEVGTARSTGRAIGDYIDSNIAELNLSPTIILTSEPLDQTSAETRDANFSVTAVSTDGSPLSYQWQLNDIDLQDTTDETVSSLPSTTTLTITDNLGGSTVVNFNQLSSYSNFITGRTYTLVSNSNLETTITALGAGGGTSIVRGVAGGVGGSSSAGFTFIAGQQYRLIVGGRGADGGSGGFGGGGNGGGGTGVGGGGGGYTGLFLSTVSQSNAIIISGGGGGGNDDPASGGVGGGSSGSGSSGRNGGAGTQSSGGSAGGADGSPGSSGSALQGGPGGAGGGGGYFGGGGGQFYFGCCAGGSGGGGSGYIHPTLLINASTTAGGGSSGDGSFRIDLLSATKTATVTASGTKTPNLTIRTDTLGLNQVKCIISHPTACNSPVITRVANFNVVEARQIVTAEGYNNTSTCSILDFNLDNGNYSIDSSVVDSDTICLYASEKDLEVEVDLYAANGVNVGSFVGGEGGYSKVRFSMKRNEEFIIKGIKSNTGLFLYRKGSLIAVVGQGGNAGTSGNGGPGGGVNVAGGNGSGRSSGSGGLLTSSGQLTTSGIFGSLSNVSTSSILSGDSKATGTLGGRTISCPKGNYWISQGKSPCEDVGNVKFRLSNGTEVSNSAIITRGFKDNYSINATAGRGIDNGGNGGSGATGGSGGVGSGGGGGSGYTNDFVNIITAGLGGNTGRTRINIKSTVGNFFVDSFGRILILSSVTVGKDPRTLTKTTDRVLPNTDTCIDDARWQNFIELARTQNYRLTATLNNSTIRITNATDNNIRRMINGNNITLKNSLTAWEDTGYVYQLLALAWDETDASGGRGFGVDYSILSWSPASAYGFGYYGDSRNPFFVGSTYNHFTANWWILPPGVPDF